MEFINKIWQTWKRIGQAIGDLVARVVLTIFYFTLFAPFGLGVRLLSDPLGIKPATGLGWLQRKTRDRQIADGRRLS